MRRVEERFKNGKFAFKKVTLTYWKVLGGGVRKGMMKIYAFSEVVRALYNDWRAYMPLCREVAWQLQGEGILQVSAGCRRLDVHASMSRGDLAAPGRGNTSG